MKINIMLDMPVPATKDKNYPEPQDKQASVEEEVRCALDAIESGHDSSIEWKTLNKFARTLRDRKDSRSVALLEKIEPVLSKYGMHGVSEGDQLPTKSQANALKKEKSK